MHVLGTPPALILSQDQTLMLKNVASPASARAATLNTRRLGFGLARTSLQRELSALRCSVTSSVAVTPGPKPRRPQADTRRAMACTHYLVFKEPTAGRLASRRQRPPPRTVLEGTLQCYANPRVLSTPISRPPQRSNTPGRNRIRSRTRRLRRQAATPAPLETPSTFRWDLEI